MTHPTPAPGFLLVSEDVARNPVARAVAKARIAQAVRDFQIRIHLLPAGEPVQADADAAAHVLAVTLAVCDQAGQGATPDSRVMQGGLNTVISLAQRGWRWRPQDAVPIDEALKRAVSVYLRATAAQVRQAHRHVAWLSTTAAMQHAAASQAPKPTAAPCAGPLTHSAQA